jgi:3-hydroxyacyl-CoA dehydrogenase
VRDLKVKDPQAEAFLQFARNTVGATSKNFPAPLKCVEAVAMCQSQALRRGAAPGARAVPGPDDHARVARPAPCVHGRACGIQDPRPCRADTPLRPIKKVGVIGAGTMGGGITMNFLNAGIPVVLLEMKQEALDKGLATIRRNYENTMKKGKLKPEQVEQRMANVTGTLTYDAFADVDLVVEAVFENMDVKKTGVRDAGHRLQARCHPGQQHQRTSTSTPSQASRSGHRTWWACTSSARPM